MSDKTPDSTGASDREDDVIEGESGDQFDTGAVEVTPVSSGGSKPAGAGRRRSTSAPVRRSAVSGPEADDEAIADLEDGFTDEEKAAAAAVRRSHNAPVKKTAPTRKRSESEKAERDPYSARNPAEFVKQSAGEIQKVVWPTWPQLTTLFLSVLIFVLFVIAFVGLLDVVFGWGLLALFGDS